MLDISSIFSTINSSSPVLSENDKESEAGIVATSLTSGFSIFGSSTVVLSSDTNSESMGISSILSTINY